MDEVRFEGHAGRECGEHRTTGHRAWCHGCTEWCYPDAPCKGCELLQLRTRVAELETALRVHFRDVLGDIADSHIDDPERRGEMIKDVVEALDEIMTDPTPYASLGKSPTEPA